MKHQTFNNKDFESTFCKHGYIVLDLLSDEDIAALQNAFKTVEAQHLHDYVASQVLGDFEMRRRVHEHISLVFKKSILDTLFNFKFVVGSFVAKRADSKKGKFPLHQDPTFVEEENYTGVSIWCPLIDVDESNGCLGVMPGSHFLENNFRSATMLPYTDLVDTIEKKYMHYIPMRAGQVMFMNTRMIHGSPPNLSHKMRPVAAGVAVPKPAPLLCCYNNQKTNPETTTVYTVDDDFYLTYMMQTIPKKGKKYKSVPYCIEQLDHSKIEKLAAV